MTLIWPSLIILHSPTSKLVRTMLHFKNTSSDRSLSDILALFGRSTMPPWLKTLFTGALEAGMANVGYGAQLVSVCHMWRYCEPRSQPALSHSHHPLHVSIWLKARPLKHQSQCHCGVLWCACSLRTTSASLVGTKDLKKGLAGRASKSKSIAFKSKSSKNGLKSGLESKSGLEYYKSATCAK